MPSIIQGIPRPFDVEHHASLFGWFAREAVNRFGEKGQEAILEGVRRYGEGRGRRMAERARTAGDKLDVVSLLAYSEIDTSCNRTEVTQTIPYLKVEALECAWQRRWQQAGLLKYGCLYCQEVDVSLVRGFDPNFAFEVEGTMTNGSARCTFCYRSGGLSLINRIRLDQTSKKIGKSAQRPFSFHVADLNEVLTNTLIEYFKDKGRQCVQAVEKVFAETYGVMPDGTPSA